jgi:hypothetical protein
MRTCNVDGCNRPVFGKGVCGYHYPKTKLKVNPQIAKDFLSCLGKSEVVGPEKQKARNDFFMSIWNKRSHVCQHCGKFLGNEPKSYMFDHILEKQKHKSLEFEEENIWLVCLECHDCKTRGILSDKYKEKINFVTTKFNVS